MCMFTSISYAGNYVSHSHETDSIISPMYVPCPVGPGQCKMYPKGQGTLYSVSGGKTTLVFSKKFTYQCSQCNQAVVCEIDKGFGYLGTHYMFNPGSQLQAVGAICTAPLNEIYGSLTKSIKVDGYKVGPDSARKTKQAQSVCQNKQKGYCNVKKIYFAIFPFAVFYNFLLQNQKLCAILAKIP